MAAKRVRRQEGRDSGRKRVSILNEIDTGNDQDDVVLMPLPSLSIARPGRKTKARRVSRAKPRWRRCLQPKPRSA